MSADLPLPPAQYYATLPKIIVSAGAILHDREQRIILVRPTYQGGSWEIPGGALDGGEDPWRCVRREVREELGIDPALGRLLAMDWMPEQPDGRPPLANYLFDGGEITQTWAEQHLRVDGREVTDWCLASPEQWEHLVPPHKVRRLHAVSRALVTGTTAYLHCGRAPSGFPT